MTRPQVVVSGMGLCSAVGWTCDEVWAALSAGRSGLRSLSLFESERCGHLPVGEIQGDVAARSGLDRGSRSDHLAMWAARQAFEDAALGPEGFAADRAGVVLGALTGGMMFIEANLRKQIEEQRVEADDLDLIECCHAAERVAAELGLAGFQSTVSNACASGAAAISVACDLLQTGQADVMLAGGTDSLNRVLLNGFNSLMLISPDGCRPFDANREGMSVGEGAGVLVLETESHARARGAPIRAILAGRGNSCDAYHGTAPRPNGEGLQRAMRLALESAGLEPRAVDYINAHGTGTKDNDLAESRAIRELFGPTPPTVSSTKRFFGHAMAAAGAVEAIVSVLALEHQAIPPNLGLRTVDPLVPFTPPGEMAPAKLEFAMSSSLGFGGNNSALLLRRAPGGPGGAR